MIEPFSEKPHLQDRPDDWIDASDEEIVDALMNRQPFVDPRFMAYIQRSRPHCLRRSILLHEQMGGYVSPIARRWLRENT